MSSRKIGFAVLALASLALLGLGSTFLAAEIIQRRMRTPPRLKTVNRSGVELQDLRLEGAGFSEDLGTLSAGASRWIEVQPTGESGVYVSFIADGRSYRSDYEGYFERSGGYRLMITIDKDFQVRVRNSIFTFP